MNGEIAEPATPLRNYNLLVPEKKSYFREFQPEKQLSFLSFSLSPSLSLSPRLGLSSHETLDREQLPVSRKSVAEERVENERKNERKGKLEEKLVVENRYSRCDDSFNLGAKLGRTHVASRFRTETRLNREKIHLR